MKPFQLLPCLAALTVCATSFTKRQTVDGDAVIVEVDGNESSGAPSTRLITGNPALDGAVVGVGVGIIGSLLVGKLLEAKDEKLCRSTRDAPSTRFLPGLFEGKKKCPPSPYQQPSNNYNQGYRPPSNNYNNQGYRPPNNYNNNYRPPTSSYNSNQSYRPPQTSYVSQPSSTYQSSSNYRPPSNYQSSYTTPSNNYQSSQYRDPIPPLSYPSRGSFSQTSAHKATPATFTAGIRPSRSLALTSHKEENNLMAAFQSGYVAPPAPTFAYGK